MLSRLLTAAVILPLFLAAVFFLSDLQWGIFLLLLTLMGAWEWRRLGNLGPFAGWSFLAIVAATGGFVLGRMASGEWAFAPEAGHPLLVAYVISAFFWVAIAPLWLRGRWQLRQPLVLALVGVVVLVPTWLAIVQLRSVDPWLLVGLMGVVWIADSAAYFSGKALGKHKLAPAISPGKTWEGVAGALVAVAVYGVLWWAMNEQVQAFFPGIFEAIGAILLLWLMTGFSVMGDLFESWLKRQAGIKDSGHFLPGHGGVLDRIDALTSSLPLSALTLTFLLAFQ